DDDSPDPDIADEWPVLHRAIFDTHNYVGPYFIASVEPHSEGFHGDDSHGCGVARFPHWVNGGQERLCSVVIENCLNAVARADLVFAWVDQLDCYGTITELGFALALGKLVCVTGSRDFRDMWFVYKAAYYRSFNFDSPEVALTSCLEHYKRHRVVVSKCTA